MEKVHMTPEGFKILEEELKKLKFVERPAVVAAIVAARALGDLSENAEYHSAKDKQGFIEGRIRELESKLSRAEVIDVKKLEGTSVKFGATVTIFDETAEKEIAYRIVGVDEADIKKKLLSIEAPLARALIGRVVGDEVELATPSGKKKYEVIKIEYRSGDSCCLI
ncbi:MAG: transcription elongation factor GreA [Holosporaceae bacterium]|nr:transcription elongation factor GreA [Holosporaceae bacterium]